MSYDWSQFSQKIKIKSSLAVIYKSWTTRSGLELWFLRMAEFSRNGEVIDNNESVAAGDTYRWRWHGYPDDITETGKILETNGKDSLSFVFGNAGIVTVNIKYLDDDLSEMEIIQSEIPTDEISKQNYHVGCSNGWTFYRCNIKSILEGGLDLRNKHSNDDMSD